jgi:choline dehydrogenase-like flavoprotein
LAGFPLRGRWAGREPCIALRREFSDPDLAVVAVKAPNAVVCLVSALTFHRAVDKRGKSIGLLLRSDRGMDAAQEFFLKARAVNRFRYTRLGSPS